MCKNILKIYDSQAQIHELENKLILAPINFLTAFGPLEIVVSASLHRLKL
ncbi:hypothetical protein AVDCRST_MAG84-7045 [uncultured Microcoleus sp.]|uniref:Uncharacterized protein n=1 Tax=uncultured Microcoleus sp. TaxID=259945 RepID=A0A6J4PMZ3_9CYAN|nr:hypothetical protein AVDCRST_MAG84-7045 [uncultured Microcoleus sp.]